MVSSDTAWEFRQARQQLERGGRLDETVFADLLTEIRTEIRMHAYRLLDRLDAFEDRLRGES